MTDQAHLALQRGLDYLRRTQHPAGSWTDFWLPVGTSDAWVTAYTGLALHAISVCVWLPADMREQADTAARQAAHWLLGRQHPQGGWGYNASVSADADSTAHAISLLARLGQPVPAEAVRFLRAHEVEGQGFRTYAWPDPTHAWTHPSPDITAAALRALHDLGELTTAELGAAWAATLGTQQSQDGLWEGVWWVTAAYPTGLALEVWDAAGRPMPCRSPLFSTPENAFDLAWQLRAQQLTAQPEAAHTTTFLLRTQAADGAWPTTPLLRVPPAHPTSGGVTLLAGGDRRIFTTASALRSLALGPADQGRPTRQRASQFQSKPPASHPLQKLVGQVALASGFPVPQAQAAQTLFDNLTRRSLRPSAPWPSRQLTALSGGMPLEFSAVVGQDAQPALRYATELVDPYLPPPARVQSGLDTLHDVVEYLGYQDSWARIRSAVAHMTHALQDAPDGTRFTLWGGIDQAAANADQPQPPAALKIYLNTLHRELSGGRARIETALQAAGLPLPAHVRQALDLLDAAGFPQELGFGLGPRGKVACKVYYELPGWNRSLVENLLDLSGLPGTADTLTPDIPGLIRATLAAKSRAGIALRLDPSSGQITDLMTACAFPIPLLPLDTTIQRVETWLEAQHLSATPYRALADALRPTWPDQDAETRAMHSLFTLTLNPQGTRTTVYLRPHLGR